MVILKVVPGTKCSFKIFQTLFRSKNKVFGSVQIPQKKTNFFIRFFGDFVPVPKADMWYFSDLGPILNMKN
jgi:hypothetical protein